MLTMKQGTGYEKCAEMYNMEFERVFNKNNLAAVCVISIFKLYRIQASSGEYSLKEKVFIFYLKQSLLLKYLFPRFENIEANAGGSELIL